jgi:hypothetical protein
MRYSVIERDEKIKPALHAMPRFICAAKDTAETWKPGGLMSHVGPNAV